MPCLTCQEIEEKICQLTEELANAESCLGQVRQEAGITLDQRGQLQAKQSALSTMRDLFKLKGCQESGQLYEFVHVPCVSVQSCEGSGCGGNRQSLRIPRRYHR